MVRVKKNNKTKEVLKKRPKEKVGPNLSIYSLNGKEKRSIALPKEIFEIEASQKLLAQYMHVYLNNQRQGTATVKTRGQVKGSTRKIYRQKGTGKARHGDIKAPIFVGGGVVGGPSRKDYFLKLNKKQKKQALFLSLSLKYKQGDIIGLENEVLNIEPKTKIILSFLNSLEINKKSILLVLPKLENDNLVLAARNLPNVALCSFNSINPYLVLKNEKVIFLDVSLANLNKLFNKNV